MILENIGEIMVTENEIIDRYTDNLQGVTYKQTLSHEMNEDLKIILKKKLAGMSRNKLVHQLLINFLIENQEYLK